MTQVPRPGELARDQRAKDELVATLLGPEGVQELDWLKERLRAFSHIALSRGVLMHWSVLVEPAIAGKREQDSGRSPEGPQSNIEHLYRVDRRRP